LYTCTLFVLVYFSNPLDKTCTTKLQNGLTSEIKGFSSMLF